VAAGGAGDALQLGAGTADAAGGQALEPLVVVDGRLDADQSGNAGMYVSGKAISAAPLRAASSMRLHAFATRLRRVEEDGRNVGGGGLERRHQAPAFFHVLIQLTVADGSLWPWPGLGQLGGAVIWPTGMVMMRSGSHTGNG